ncbi:hypothetical protein OIU78_009177 [Salix suchowensis]|nr:hypothetical protein OIU78_009177 [Salix suchowensis]
MPTEDPTDEDWNRFLEKPEAVLLETYPSKLQATTIIAALYVLSYHSPSEEYIGEHIEAAWADDPTIRTAFENVQSEVEGVGRNNQRKEC